MQAYSTMALVRQVCRRTQIPNLLCDLGLTGLWVELGVEEGKFSQRLLEVGQPKHLFCVDVWANDPNGFQGQSSEEEHQKRFRTAQTTLAAWTKCGRASIHRMDTRTASRLFADEVFDFIYVDAGHSDVEVTRDLLDWFPKLKRGGVIAGDDYEVEGEWHAVPCGVDRFADNVGLQLHVTDDHNWITVKP